MRNVFIEENGAYSINCTYAVWATDRIHEDYHNAGIHINDVDFLIEDAAHIFMVEYKNASLADADNPGRFSQCRIKKYQLRYESFMIPCII
ncbi:MAG: hypothetical protein HFG80_03095 [Eubacterium sp.]|nr:hypothetical protein [Eubacterium sp.]